METRELKIDDLMWCVRRIPKAVRNIMSETAAFLPIVGGGFIRSCIANEPIADIDMFVCEGPTPVGTGKFQAETLAVSLSLAAENTKYHKTENAFTFDYDPWRYPIQVIHRWTFKQPRDVIESLDFTICQAVIWYDRDSKQWTGTCSDTFYEDLAAKRLRYTSPVRDEDAGGSILRVLKYYQRGYRIPLDSFGRVLGRLLSGVTEENWQKRTFMDKAAWEEQMGMVFTGLLRVVDPLIDVSHIAHLPTAEENTKEL